MDLDEILRKPQAILTFYDIISHFHPYWAKIIESKFIKKCENNPELMHCIQPNINNFYLIPFNNNIHVAPNITIFVSGFLSGSKI